MIDDIWNSYMIWSEALIEDDFPRHFLQIFQLTSLQGWQSNRQKPPTTSRHGWQLFNKRSLFGLQHSISELADRFLKCSLGKCIEIWGVDTFCGSYQVPIKQLVSWLKRRPFWWSFSWEQSFPPGSASTLFLLGSWSIQEGNRWWVCGGESAVAFCG